MSEQTIRTRDGSTVTMDQYDLVTVSDTVNTTVFSYEEAADIARAILSLNPRFPTPFRVYKQEASNE